MPEDSSPAQVYGQFLHRELFSSVGWALFLIPLVSGLFQLTATYFLWVVAPQVFDDMLVQWLLSTLPVYGVAIPFSCFLLWKRKVPPTEVPPCNLSISAFVQTYFIALAALYLSNYVTAILTSLVSAFRDSPVANPVETIIEYPTLLRFVLICILAPVAEEVFFRRMILNRLRPYGDKFAMVASALCFGLFHGNLNQLLYATSVGMVLAYVALRTGRIRQAILLHAMVNGLMIWPLPALGDLGELGDLLLTLFVLLSIILGVFFLFRRRKSRFYAPGIMELSPRGTWKLFLTSPGIICFCLISLVTILSYLAL